MEKPVAVTIVTDMESFPYCCIMLHSLTEHISKQIQYDILVFGKCLTGQMKQTAFYIISEYGNVQLRFFEISDSSAKTEQIKWYLPFFLKQYGKILYLDTNLIILDNLEKIRNKNFADHAQKNFAYTISGCEHDFSVLWIDAEKYRRFFTDKQMKPEMEDYKRLRKFGSEKTGILDKSFLHVICYKNKNFLDLELSVNSNFEFWKYARKSSYYELILERAFLHTMQVHPEAIKDIGLYRNIISDTGRMIWNIEHRKVGLYWILTFMKVWMKSRIKMKE